MIEKQYLFQYLKQRPQDDAPESTKPLNQMAAQLVQPHLTGHPEKEVRLHVACCLSDMFRVYAPDMPYDDEQLQVRVNLML